MLFLLPTAFAAFLAFGMPGTQEMIIVLIIALLLFGRRLPEVGRWLGQGIVEFKKGIKGINEDIEEESSPREPERLDTARREQQPQQSSQHQPAEQARQDA